MSSKPPEKLVVMGRVSAPFGVRGWVRIQPFTATIDGLTAYGSWWLDCDGEWREYGVEGAQARGSTLVAKFSGCDDRDGALQFRGRQIAVPRAMLPKAAANEFYWADLIGLRVVNEQAQDFGEVIRILETGANEVLVVRKQDGQERLIPFIADAISRVDLDAGVIRVNWGADY